MTDEEYASALANLAGGREISAVIVDPSAASFIEVLRRKGWRVQKAENDEYVWDLSSGSKDRVRKEHDHAMDDMRYFAATVLGEKQGGFVACSVERKR